MTFLVAHFLVGGAAVHGHGAPRGERELHMGEAYAATPEAIPAGPQYVALGHIHAPQPIPGVQVPGEYAGSLLELDFGEAGEQKRVVVVDVEPGLPARIRSFPVTGGRRLMRPAGPWEKIISEVGIYESYLDLTVETAGPDPGLADRAREEFDYLVRVRADYPRPDVIDPGPDVARSLEEQYADYYELREGAPAPDSLLGAFRDVLEEVTAGAAS